MNKNLLIARRKLLKLVTIILGTGIAARVMNSRFNSATEAQTMMNLEKLDHNSTPEQILAELISGNKRFIKKKAAAPHQDYLPLQDVSIEREPLVSVMSCAGSRVPVELIFDRGGGDLFVVRNAGNIATPEEISNLEYGTVVLGSKVLMVLGHEKCGTVRAALEGKALPGQMGSIVAAIQPAINRANKNNVEQFYIETIKRNVTLQVAKLNSSPLLQELVEQGELKIVGAYYSLKTGEVVLL